MTRLFFYVQHLYGVGHLRRAAAVAKALAAQDFEVLLVSGGFPVPNLDLGKARLEQLPPLRTNDETFSRLLTPDGEDASETYKQARRDQLLALFQGFAPEVLVTEQYPFGRRQLRFELEPLIAAAQAQDPRPLILSSVRDVLVAPKKPGKAEWMRDAAAAFDGVIIHGQEDLIPFARTFPYADVIAEKLRYSGYVLPPAPGDDGGKEGAGEVIVSIGGGAFGLPVAEAALQAKGLSPAVDKTWRLLLGHNLPEADFQRLKTLAWALYRDGMIVERARPDFELLLGRASLSISQGGYNTVMEVLRSGVRAVVVPYSALNETEQLFRAQVLAEKGLLTVVDDRTLTPGTLAAGIARAYAAVQQKTAIKSDGARETGRLIRAMLLASRQPSGAGV